jgi:Fem-1 family protein b
VQFTGSGHLDIVQVLLGCGATVDLCTKTKSTPLRAACYIGREDIVECLIQYRADVNRTNIFNSTCLMIASYKGKIILYCYS